MLEYNLSRLSGPRKWFCPKKWVACHCTLSREAENPRHIGKPKRYGGGKAGSEGHRANDRKIGGLQDLVGKLHDQKI